MERTVKTRTLPGLPVVFLPRAAGALRQTSEPGAQARGVAFLVFLLGTRDRQGVLRDVARHGGAGCHIGVLADAHRGDELRVAADESAVLEHRDVLLEAVVVAEDRPRSDVDVVADLAVAE